MLSKIQKTRLTNAVNRGITKLTKHEGSLRWAEQIDLDRLEMFSRESCVIGQLNDGVYDPSKVLGEDIQDARFGFVIPGRLYDGNDSEAYDYLTMVWTHKVRQIQNALKNLAKRYAGVR